MIQEDIWPFSTLFIRCNRPESLTNCMCVPVACVHTHLGRLLGLFTPGHGICVVRLQPQGQLSSGQASAPWGRKGRNKLEAGTPWPALHKAAGTTQAEEAPCLPAGVASSSLSSGRQEQCGGASGDHYRAIVHNEAMKRWYKANSCGNYKKQEQASICSD